ncbi:hypothetical protein [Microbacterium sp. SD291]|uniref:hypothetical protein n=1 Tax=Microbacterium sp. SD291 TaxID=2782007 RepID=UPI001A956EE2|nr:hypothetical protein [Microbacterium sp. SD291]MBO0981708.1 hypothetical protein [Microbacterium sp. SD291]
MSASGDSSPASAGASASRAVIDRITTEIYAGAEVEKLLHLRAIHLSPADLFVAVKVALSADRSLPEVADDIDAIKTRIRTAVPNVLALYIEPDVYRPSADPAPSTDVFVLKSAD